MNSESLESLEGALDRVSRRLAESHSPVPDAAARVRRLEREPWLRLAWTAALIGLAIYTGNYLTVGGLLLLAVPFKVNAVRKRRDQIELLNSSVDLLALEVQSLTERHGRLGVTAALALWIGALFAGVGAFSPRPLVGLCAGLILLALAVYLLRWWRPRLRRALADLGAAAEDHWSGHHLAVVLFLFLPVFALVALLRSVMGWDKEDDQPASGADAAGGGSSAADGPSGAASGGAQLDPTTAGSADSAPQGEERP